VSVNAFEKAGIRDANAAAVGAGFSAALMGGHGFPFVRAWLLPAFAVQVAVWFSPFPVYFLPHEILKISD
jgi:hypothetical protein